MTQKEKERNLLLNALNNYYQELDYTLKHLQMNNGTTEELRSLREAMEMIAELRDKIIELEKVL